MTKSELRSLIKECMIEEGFFGGSSSNKISTEEKKERTIKIIRDIYNASYKGKNGLYDQVRIAPHESPYVSLIYVSAVDESDALAGLIDVQAMNLIKHYVDDLNKAFGEDSDLKSKANLDSTTYKITVSY